MIQGRNRAWKRAFGVRDDASVARLNTILVGIVKSNDDPQRMGRLRVWIPEMGGSPDDEDNWFIVSYASPFAGSTSASTLRRDGQDMASSSTSYGWWSVPPDLDNEVLVAFANGDPSKGFWFACLYQQNMNHMVPGIPAGLPTGGQASVEPSEPSPFVANAASANATTTSGTTGTTGTVNDAPAPGIPITANQPSAQPTGQPPVVEYNRWSNVNPDTAARPSHDPLFNALVTQGLVNDPQRGTTTAGARRGAPAHLYGLLTPGGSSMYIDDGEDAHIRFRTRNGTQVLINDATGFVYINSGSGNSWLQVSDHSVDVYSMGTVNIRSESSVNIRADGSLNLEAVGNLNLRSGANINMSAAGSIGMAANGDHIVEAGGTVSAKGGAAILQETGGSIRMTAGGAISQGSGGNNIRSAANILDNSGAAPAAGALAAPEAEKIDGSVTRRMPTHEPFAGHAKDGSGPALVGAAENSGAADGSIATIPSDGEAPDLSNVSATELDWLVACMIDEAGTEPADGRAAVAQIIKNRMAVGGWMAGATIKDTILKKDQFSGFYHGHAGGRYRRICSDKPCAERRGLQKIAEYRAQRQRAWQECTQIAQQVLAGTYQGGAGFQAIRANRRCIMYLNYAACQQMNPGGAWKSWAVQRRFVTKIGRHSFYVDRG